MIVLEYLFWKPYFYVYDEVEKTFVSNKSLRKKGFKFLITGFRLVYKKNNALPRPLRLGFKPLRSYNHTVTVYIVSRNYSSYLEFFSMEFYIFYTRNLQK